MAIPINSDVIHTPPLTSATVMVVRDGPSGLEVLLVRRHGNSGVLGGVHVFPGGKLDAADRQVDPAALDRTAAELLSALAEPGLDQDTAGAAQKGRGVLPHRRTGGNIKRATQAFLPNVRLVIR